MRSTFKVMPAVVAQRAALAATTLVIALGACGGRPGSGGKGGNSGSATEGRSGAGAGGATGTGGIASGSAGGGGSSGGSGGSDAGIATDGACDHARLWRAVAGAYLGPSGLGYCYQKPAAWPVTDSQGTVVSNAEGRVIDNTGPFFMSTPGSKQAWLDMLDNDRFPCLADQTVPYECSVE